MKVQNFMTADVHTVSPDDSAYDAWRVLISNRIRQIPVVDGDTVKGIVSRTDLLRRANHIDFESTIEQRLPLKEVMSEYPVTTAPDAPLAEAAVIMYENKVSSLPVTEGGKLKGIITKSDMFRAMTELLEFKK